MKCTPETRWKYLRESNTKFFDPKRNTSLQEYLESIFPNYVFEYQSSIKKAELPKDIEPKRYVCDAICRNSKLIVEFDGLNHYMDTSVCINDMNRDRWFKQLEYRTVRIPYWIQLSREVIEDLFNIEVPQTSEFCQLNCSFYCPEKDTIDFNILPGNMCELGRTRFIHEFFMFRKTVQLQIVKDLEACWRYCIRNYLKSFRGSVLPHATCASLMHISGPGETKNILEDMDEYK